MTPLEFIKIYQESNSLDEISERTGLCKDVVISRAFRYRKKGIELKRFKGGINSNISDSEFIQIWNDSNTVKEVMNRTHFTASNCHKRRRILIQSGHYLKPIINNKTEYQYSIDELVQCGFGYWLAGFVDGEGCLGVRITHRANGKYNTIEVDVSLGIALRADDKSTLEYIQKMLGCGYLIAFSKGKIGNPQYTWKVSKVSDIINRVIPIFENCQLHTKKKNEFPLFKRAAYIKHDTILRKYSGKKSRNGTRLTDDEVKELENIVNQIKEIRRYK